MSSLAVLVSCYNSGDWLENRLKNLLASTVASRMEIICVNANSPDKRDDEIPKNFPVTYHKLEDRISVYEAWNYAIERSSSTYITNANTDDLVAPHCYEVLMSILDDGADYAYPSWYTTHIPNLVWGDHDGKVDPSGDPGQYCGDLSKSGVGHFPMWRRSLHDKLGYFKPEFNALGDAEFWARAYYLAKAKFVWYPEMLAIYLWRDGQNLWNRSINEVEWGRYHNYLNKYTSESS